MATLKNTNINDTGFLKFPIGTTAQRPASPAKGYTRFNTDTNSLELYNGSEWVNMLSNNYNATVIPIDYAIIAGGGPSGDASVTGWNFLGGGGAGGLLTGTISTSLGCSVSMTIGAGGATFSNGSNTTFGSLVACGGGRGGDACTTAIVARPGFNGGSGGGGSGRLNSAGGIGVTGQGTNGGRALNSSTAGQQGGGGGGGAATAGCDSPSNTIGGNGGAGKYIQLLQAYHAGGGGGGASSCFGIGGAPECYGAGGSMFCYTSPDLYRANGGSSGVIVFRFDGTYHCASFSAGVTCTTVSTGNYITYIVTAANSSTFCILFKS